MIEKVRHVGIVVANLELMQLFFEKALGFDVFVSKNEEGSFIDTILALKNVKVETVKMISSCGTVVELLKFHSHQSNPVWTGDITTTGLTHIALQVKNIDDCLEKLEGFNCKTLGHPDLNPERTARVCFVKCPENLFIELVQLGSY